MKQHNVLDISRFKQLLINDIRVNKKTMLVAAATIVVYWILLTIPGSPSWLLYNNIVLFLGGFILTSQCFKELHNTELAYHYLTLPCTNFERFLSKWFLTSVGYAIGLMVLFYLFSLFCMGYNLVLFQNLITLPSLFEPAIWHQVGTYIVLQSIVLLGAVVFKRYSLLKTALTLGCIFLTLSLVAWTVGIKLFPYWMPSAVQNFDIFKTITGILFWAVLAPFCWAVTYLRISEYEIN